MIQKKTATFSNKIKLCTSATIIQLTSQADENFIEGIIGEMVININELLIELRIFWDMLFAKNLFLSIIVIKHEMKSQLST